MFEVAVRISLKEGISDPEGSTTLKSLQLLGFDTVRDVRTQKVFMIKMDETDEKTVRRKVEEMCQRLLTNPVIHRYEIEMKRVD
ncbi:MAG TPA: phosphoribosylformylglycinamidine synthase, purS protein [Thermoplasmatales archaeon]|nr:phosphoribosylformylglycinamidine synthase, purS protein [Thermoplasmatales archaeon]HEX17125.1 phosphoribosylformylglycinamidine synthase, purS protein [Thermoplasmatales archaeon]